MNRALNVLLITSIAFTNGAAFVLPIGKIQIAGAITSHATTINSLQLGVCQNFDVHRVGMQQRRKHKTSIGSKENDEDDKASGEAEETEAEETPPVGLPRGAAPDIKEPSVTSKVTFGVFQFFSYCIQFLGAFFFVGLILNLLGFGYTFSLEKGLVIDNIQNIRNEVQFEREIEREEREDLKGMSGSQSYIIAPNVPENNMDSI